MTIYRISLGWGTNILVSRPDVPPVDPKPSPSFRAVQRDSRYHAPTPRFGAKSVPSFGKPYEDIDPKMSGASDPLRIPRPKGPSYEDWLKSKMGETKGFTTGEAPTMPGKMGKFLGTKARGKREESGGKHIRPTTL